MLRRCRRAWSNALRNSSALISRFSHSMDTGHHDGADCHHDGGASTFAA